MDPQDARRSSSLPVLAEACGNGSERIGRAVSLFEEPFHAAESMTIRGEERGQILITDGVSMDWRSSLAVRNHYGGSVAAELALAIELPDATWPQSCPTLARRARCGGADIVERKVKTSLAIPVGGWRAQNIPAASARLHL